jgi:uncharacterized protein YcfL
MKKLVACLLLASLFLVGCGDDVKKPGSAAKPQTSGSAK